jgi:hypothetical protein
MINSIQIISAYYHTPEWLIVSFACECSSVFLFWYAWASKGQSPACLKTVFWDVASCRLVDAGRHLRGAYWALGSSAWWWQYLRNVGQYPDCTAQHFRRQPSFYSSPPEPESSSTYPPWLLPVVACWCVLVAYFTTLLSVTRLYNVDDMVIR